MATIDGRSYAAIRFLRTKPAALAVFWIYASRCNYENVAWPSLRGLEYSTGWSINVCGDARKFLVEHGALERIPDYVRPHWRKLPEAERRKRLGLDKSEYYRPTGVILFDGKTYPLLYDPSRARRKRKPDVTPDVTSTPDDSPGDTSRRVTSQPVQHVPGESELDSIPQLDSSGSQLPTTTTDVVVVIDDETSQDLESTDDDVQINRDAAKVFTAYQENIGLITPVMRDTILLALKDYPTDWIVEAITRAVQKEKRSWAYAEGILKNWKRDGKNTPAPGKQTSSAAATSDADRRLKALIDEELKKLPGDPPQSYLPKRTPEERAKSWQMAGRRGTAKRLAEARLEKEQAPV